MKKNIFIIIIALGLIIINTSACKRNSSTDPGNLGPTGRGITLAGSADPDTLTLPSPNITWVEIKATRYNPDAPEPYSPANGESIVLEPGVGRFEGYNLGTNVTKTTNASGIVRWKYIIGPEVQGSIRINTTDYVQAILVDNQDPSDTSNYCVIPVNIIPFQQKDYITVSGRVIDQFSNKGVENVIIELSTGGVTKTPGRGTFSFTIWGGASQGWSGDITPTLEGASFIPSSATWGTEDSPIYSDIYQTFYALVKQAIAVSRPEIYIDNSGSSATGETVYVYCTPDAEFAANFYASSSANWINISTTGNIGSHTGSISGTTPMNIYITIDAYPLATTDRTGTVDITATSPQNAVSSVTISITQAF